MPEAPNRDILSILLQGQNPGAYLQQSGQQAQSIASETPSQRFGLKLMELLKQYQRPDLMTPEIEAREQQAARVFQTPQELYGAAPAIQERVRKARTQAVEPTITGIRETRQMFDQRLQDLKDVIGVARQIGADIETSQAKIREDSQNFIDDQFDNFGSTAFSGEDPKEMEELEKAANLPRGWVLRRAKTLKEKELATKTGADISTLDNWVQLLSTGQVGLQQVPLAMRNAVINRAQETGAQILSPVFAGKRADAIQSFNSANSLVDLLGTQALSVINARDFLGRIGQTISLGYGARTQQNPAATAYLATRDAFLSMLTRAAGEKGMLTNQDVARIKKSLPDFNDRREVAEKKLANLRSLFDSIRTGAEAAFTGGTAQGNINAPDGSVWKKNADGTYTRVK